MTRRCLLLLSTTIGLSGCKGSTPAARPLADVVAAPADSMRGVVQRIGAEPQTQLTARGADGATCVLRFPAAIPGIEGLEVTLWGARATGVQPAAGGATCALTVTRYAVRAVDGVPAVDGILLLSETSYALDLAGGARPQVWNVPPTLKAQVGARIFWAGPLDRAPVAYGVLEPARR